MKKLQTLMLMMLVAFMGLAVQSCGSDDDKGAASREQFTLSAELTDAGNLTDDEKSAMQAGFAQIGHTVTATESEAKAALDESIEMYKDSYANTAGKNYTVTFFLKNASGKVVYQKSIVVQGQNVTVI